MPFLAPLKEKCGCNVMGMREGDPRSQGPRDLQGPFCDQPFGTKSPPWFTSPGVPSPRPQGLPVPRFGCMEVFSGGRPAARTQIGGFHRPLISCFFPLLQQCNPPLEVKDLFVDIQDGKILMALLEVLSGQNLVRMSQRVRETSAAKENCWSAFSTQLYVRAHAWPCAIP